MSISSWLQPYFTSIFASPEQKKRTEATRKLIRHSYLRTRPDLREVIARKVADDLRDHIDMEFIKIYSDKK